MTSFHSANASFYPTYVSARRYRYNGKERDEETGLYYYGARYYAAWLGRWTAVDPAGLRDGTNIYAYVRNNPIKLNDPNGMQGEAQGTIESLKQDPWKYFWKDRASGGAGGQTERTSNASSSTLVSEAEPTRSVSTQERNQRSSQADLEADREREQEEQETQALKEFREGKAVVAQPAPTKTLEQQAQETLPQTGGGGLVAAWDTGQRLRYLSKAHRASAEALEEMGEARGDIAKAETAARRASDYRTEIRAATQEQLTPGGRAVSKAIEKPLTFEEYAAKYRSSDPFETYWNVAFKAGQGNKTMRYVTGGGTVLGPTLLAIGIVSALNEVSTAAPDQQSTVAAREVYGMLFGATGASLGSSLGAGAAVATGVALGITPPGWLVIGLALIGSAVVGYWGTKAGRELVGTGSDGGT